MQFILFTLFSLLMLGCGPKYTAKNGTVYKDGTPLHLYGVNWFGFESCDCAPQGLWSGWSIEDILSQFKALGFNAIRLPDGPEVLRNNCITPSFTRLLHCSQVSKYGSLKRSMAKMLENSKDSLAIRLIIQKNPLMV